jgi:1,5-anhydro-D-fructose reductase (1,5-anhydro-D-mannitol-forming)
MIAEIRLDRSLRWGVVGLGGFVRGQIAPAIGRSGALMTACATRDIEDAQRFAAEFAVKRAYATVEELADDPDVDAVFVATPNGEHRRAVLAAARAGKHVLCEKPLALSLEEAKEMQRACDEAGVLLRMGLQFRLEEVLLHVREILQAGDIGMPLMLDIERTSALDQPGAWRRDRAKGGSILYDTGVHLLDLVTWMLRDDLETLFAVGHQGRRDSSSEDSLSILGQMRRGCQMVIRISREAPFGNNTLTIMGTKGLIRTGALRLANEHVVTVTTEAGETERRFAPTDLYARELSIFSEEVRNRSSELPNGEDGVRLVTTTLAVLRSLDTGQAVAVA